MGVSLYLLLLYCVLYPIIFYSKIGIAVVGGPVLIRGMIQRIIKNNVADLKAKRNILHHKAI